MKEKAKTKAKTTKKASSPRKAHVQKKASPRQKTRIQKKYSTRSSTSVSRTDVKINKATEKVAVGQSKEVKLVTEGMTEREREEIYAHNRANAIEFFGLYLPPPPEFDESTDEIDEEDEKVWREWAIELKAERDTKRAVSPCTQELIEMMVEDGVWPADGEQKDEPVCVDPPE